MRHFKIKNIFRYVVIEALVMALFISCKSNENPPAGTYTGSSAKDKVRVSADGTIEGGLLYVVSETSNQEITFKVKVNNWYRHSNYDTHYVKEGSYEVISFSPNNYTFANSSGYGLSY